jgi:hypothetical protein
LVALSTDEIQNYTFLDFIRIENHEIRPKIKTVKEQGWF